MYISMSSLQPRSVSKIKTGGVMDIQTKEALIAEIERFKTESLKIHIVKVWAESYTNTDVFDYVILEKENNKIWWMKAQAYQLWKMWKAAQVVPEVVTIGDELQSWVAVNSFSADDGEGVLPVVDANALAEKIEELTGANQ
jgi:hypothetical protein